MLEGNLSFKAWMPAGNSDIAQMLEEGSCYSAFENSRSAEVTVQIPKLDLLKCADAEFYESALSSAGLERLYDSGALEKFSRAGAELDGLYSETVLRLDEEGVQTAKVVIADADSTSALDEEPEIIAFNRPFVFHIETGDGIVLLSVQFTGN